MPIVNYFGVPIKSLPPPRTPQVRPPIFNYVVPRLLKASPTVKVNNLRALGSLATVAEGVLNNHVQVRGWVGQEGDDYTEVMSPAGT